MKPCACGCGTVVPYSRVYAYMHAPGASITATRHALRRDEPLGDCVMCDATVLTQAGWRMRSVEEREGFRRVGSQSPELRCNRCYKAVKRAEDPNKVPGRKAPQMRSEEVLEEWVLLRSDGVTDLEVAAGRIGTTKIALQKVLERARKRGDDRGIVHRNDQLSGGVHVGTTGHTTQGSRYAA